MAQLYITLNQEEIQYLLTAKSKRTLLIVG